MEPIRRVQGSRRDGGALLMALFIVLIFSSLTIGLFKLTETNAVETVHAEHRKQAFWLAEAGIDKSMFLIQEKVDFRGALSTVGHTKNLSEINAAVNGRYDVEVERVTAEGDENITNAYFEIESVGTVGGIQRTLTQRVRSYPGYRYAAVGYASETTLTGTSKITGAMAQLDGNLDIRSGMDVDGYLVLGDSVILRGQGKNNVTIINRSIPEKPAMKVIYSEQIEAIESGATPIETVSLDTISDTLLTYDADTVNFTTNIVIADDTKIIAAGNVTFDDDVRIGKDVEILAKGNVIFGADVEIGKNVKILANGITLSGTSKIGGGSLLFSTRNILIANQSKAVPPDNEDGVILLAHGRVELASQSSFRGVIFGDGGISIGSESMVHGCVLGGGGAFTLNQDAEIIFDPAVFLGSIPFSDYVAGTEVIVDVISWKE